MSANPNPLPLSACPTCGYQMDAATSIENPKHQPRPDDFSLCGKCGEVLVYDADLTLRAADLKDMLKLTPRSGQAMTQMQQVIRQHRFIK